MTKQAAAYIRVSTDDQLEYSPDAQKREILKYAACHDMILEDCHLFVDEGISGRNTKGRLQFNRMIALAKTKPRPFEVILLWKFSRFARNREDSIVYKSMLRKQCGIEVISITENVGSDKMAILIEAMIEAMDEYYSINLAEEVKRGMTEKACRGGFQSAPPFGYRKEPGKPLQPDGAEAEHVQAIFRRFLAGDSPLQIAKALNEKGVVTKRGNLMETRTVEYILNNPIYKGCVRWTPTGKTVSNRIYDSPDTIVARSDQTPLVSERDFDRAARRLKRLRLEKAAGPAARRKNTKH